ncbi:TIGR04141 family sporadically distributed protein [Actinomyces bowdenii]|nr:TIGR04141 family sporadically distributed protein [Actinomyces bowdenii]
MTLRVARFPQKWLSFEADPDGKKHFLHSGCWYAIESDYAEVALGRVREIFSRPNQMQMIPWAQEYDDELTYNQKLAEVNDGVCLDRALISIRSRKSRIEDCDALLERGVFVHVKRTDGSASASHLIAQAHEGPGEDPALGALEEIGQGAAGLGIGQREGRRQVVDDRGADALGLETGAQDGHRAEIYELDVTRAHSLVSASYPVSFEE